MFTGLLGPAVAHNRQQGHPGGMQGSEVIEPRDQILEKLKSPLFFELRGASITRTPKQVAPDGILQVALTWQAGARP